MASIVAWACILMAPAILIGHIGGHSSFFNVVWSEGFASHLFAGEFYPRWLPDVSQGGGSPVFYFYGPLPFFVTAPYHLIADSRLAVVLGSTTLLALSGVTFFKLARTVATPASALFASAVYMALPYHLLADVWARAAIGEQAAFIFLPLCLFYAKRIGAGPQNIFGLAFSFAGLLYSHLPTAMIFSAILAGFCISTAINERSVVVLLRSAIAALLAAGLAAPYLLPALSLQDLIDQNFWGVFRPTDHHLFGSGGDDFRHFLEMSFAVIALLVLWLSYAAFKSGDWRPVAPWAIMAIVVAFLVTPLSSFIWTLSPVVDRIQFPWRALSIFGLSAAMVLAISLDTIRADIARRLFAVSMVGLVAIFAFSRVAIGTLAPIDSAEEAGYIAMRADAREYLPACRPAAAFGAMQISPTSHMEVSAALAVADERLLPVFYYPFLKAFADGAPVATICDPATGRIKLENAAQNVEVRRLPPPVERWAMVIGSWTLVVSLLSTGLLRRFGGDNRGGSC